MVSCAILVFTSLHYFYSSQQRKLRSMQLTGDKLCNRKFKSQHCSVTYLGFSWEESAKFGNRKWVCVFSETPPLLAGLTQRMMQISLLTEVPPCLLMRTSEPVPTLEWNTAEGHVGYSPLSPEMQMPSAPSRTAKTNNWKTNSVKKQLAVTWGKWVISRLCASFSRCI